MSRQTRRTGNLTRMNKKKKLMSFELDIELHTTMQTKIVSFFFLFHSSFVSLHIERFKARDRLDFD